MKLIEVSEIEMLYKKVNIDITQNRPMRNNINTGMLDNQLNTTVYEHMSQGIVCYQNTTSGHDVTNINRIVGNC